MKNNYLTAIILSSVTLTTAQAQDFKFGKFTNEEIAKTQSKITATAPAEVLFSSVRHRIDFDKSTGELMRSTIVNYRIKIYDKDKAPNYLLKLDIPIRKGSSRADTEKLSNVKASTFVPSGSTMKEFKVEKKDMFTKNVHNYLDVQTLTFPNVQNGSIIDYSYEIFSPFYFSTDTWYFQETVPVVKSTFIIDTHESLNYNSDIRGQYTITPKTSSKRESVNTSVSTDTSVNLRSRPDQVHYEYEIKQASYSVENLPGTEREAYVLNPRNLLSSVRFELASYNPRNGSPKSFTTSWETIAKDLMQNDDFGKQISGNSFLDDTVKQLTADKATANEKMIAIFNYVKTNFKWNEYTGLYTENGVRKTFNEKKGSAADINLLLISMLQKAGINANPVVLSTVENGIINYTFPSRSKLNYVIASVATNEGDVLMDATDLYAQVNVLPIRAVNYRGFEISKDGYREINLVNSVMSTDKYQIVANLSADGKISGTYNNYHDNYFYMNDKNEIDSDAKQFEKEYIEDYTFDIENFKSLDNNEGTIRHSFKFNNVQADVAGDKIILNPLLFTALENHNLNFETRNYNIEFGTAMAINKTIKIRVPEGYKVESLPKDYQEKIVNDAAGYAYKFEEKDGYINVTSMRVLPYSVLPYDYYKLFKDFMNKVVEAENQQIVLVKK